MNLNCKAQFTILSEVQKKNRNGEEKEHKKCRLLLINELMKLRYIAFTKLLIFY